MTSHVALSVNLATSVGFILTLSNGERLNEGLGEWSWGWLIFFVQAWQLRALFHSMNLRWHLVQAIGVGKGIRYKKAWVLHITERFLTWGVIIAIALESKPTNPRIQIGNVIGC